MKEKELVERRKHKRFYYKNGGPFAVTGPGSTHLGQVVNVSLGGFAFRYIEENGETWRNDSVDYEVFFGKTLLPLHDIQLETVFDTNENCPATFTSKNLRQRGVRFVNLTPEQEDLLQAYIREDICGNCGNLASKASSEIECKLACIYDPSFAKSENQNFKSLSDVSQVI